ncbi:hypothetical protein QYE76_049204 [Lolium multiflorum]|uniref:F-box domain-containing protein n=1 Tax=Lolium multiflorum TaxID=4521 RepID=A0AAD8WI33_LOLMU|nr:hypothetical protein QYE76_049204 [Lolium multiflorum]
MGSPSNKRRRVLDRLSDLPDCLLHDILSRLGSRQAAHTSALSRRWRHLWRDVPCADLDEREFVNSSWVRFEDFADHLLTSIPPETQLDAFRLNLARGKDREIYLGPSASRLTGGSAAASSTSLPPSISAAATTGTSPGDHTSRSRQNRR